MLSLLIGYASSTTLREAANGTGVYMGAALNYYHLDKDAPYADLAKQEYSLATPENACKMYTIAKSASENDYSQCLSVKQFAVEQAKMAFRAHNLIWAVE